MERIAITRVTLLFVWVAAGCGGSTTDHDSGPGPGRDAGHYPDGAAIDAGPSGTDMGGAHVDMGCVPGPEICGDHIDQNCDGHDESCGDNDHDGADACRPGDDLTMCDCDDTRADVRPARGGLPGAPEVCDGVDNNCNGRIDESALCCAGCAALAPHMERGDICAVDGTCVCSTEGTGTAPCAVGQTCCGGGCTDTSTDLMNCGRCMSACTNQSDRCTGGNCMCGSGPPCALDTMCPGAGGC